MCVVTQLEMSKLPTWYWRNTLNSTKDIKSVDKFLDSQKYKKSQTRFLFVYFNLQNQVLFGFCSFLLRFFRKFGNFHSTSFYVSCVSLRKFFLVCKQLTLWKYSGRNTHLASCDSLYIFQKFLENVCAIIKL